MKSSKYWDNRALQRLSEAEKSSEIYINRIKKIYDQAFKNVEKEIENIYRNYAKNVGLDVQKLKEKLTKSQTNIFWKSLTKLGLNKYVKNNYKSRISRLEQIQAQIYAKAKEIYSKEELEQTMCYKGIINKSYNKAIYDTQMGTGYNFSFNKIDEKLTNTLLNEKWSGGNYSARIWNNTDILADNLSEVIGGALLSGQSIEKTTRQIRDRFNVSKYYAERLVRTETNYFNNQADALAYEEMGVDKYVFVATLDGRTSKKCQNMDNKKFYYKDLQLGINYPPLHPNCRSKTRGYVSEEVEKTLKRRAKNPITGKTELVNNISYNEWVKNVMGIDENNKSSYNNLSGTGKIYEPQFNKIKGEHTIQSDSKNTNPNYNDKEPQWYRNCQRCVPTYEMRRRGYDVEALPKYQSDKISRNPQIVYNDPQIQYFTQNAKETIIKEMNNWGDGSRCQICVRWTGRGGHTFIAERQNGKVMFIDPQINNLDVSKYFDEIKVKNSYFYRIDNLDVTDYIKDCCKGVNKDDK